MICPLSRDTAIGRYLALHAHADREPPVHTKPHSYPQSPCRAVRTRILLDLHASSITATLTHALWLGALAAAKPLRAPRAIAAGS